MSGVVTTEENIENVKAVYLSADDLKVAASILYNAYFDDPLFMDIFQAEREGYESRLRSAIREELTAFWDAKQPMIGLFDDSRILSVACLTRPCVAFSSGRFWHWRLKMLLTAGLFGTRQMVEKEEKVRACMPATKYHMLSFIAVHPDHQHHGLGHQLMGAIDSVLEDEVDSEGVGVFVTVPKYRSFFEHGNYELICKLEVGQVSGEIMFKRRSG
ncbi:GNAT family N-acetyltransferase [Alteromonas pelagimontana]|uniref:GNAT family N-acetyltransferase n=1 Tax=Alteromonas pelagimontana TaxID=1858656 RepID=A0A6M4MF21_9ALTE|nr:GNAT family N-acetyltransferase [Alteromonas pelagimontana]QJR81764.1 GNAT family N-acetyltransferase [Alteromonas pelagimontana]